MPSKADYKLYADECFPLDSVKFLKSLGYSVAHAKYFKSLGKPDSFHLKLAQREKRSLITLDRDFLFYEQVGLTNHPGVIVIQVGSAIPEQINKVCIKALQNITEDFLKDSLIKISQTKIIKIKDRKIIFEKSI